MSLEELKTELSTSLDGLSREEAERRLDQYGPNKLPEEKTHPVVQFLSYFWGPIPWMIEAAVVLSAAVGHWTDFIVIMVLLAFNGVVGFWEEHQAENAVEALKEQLAVRARVKRDQQWNEIDATELVPGDVVRLRLGDIIPADVKLAQGDYLSVDQSALTGESLPVDKEVGDVAYSGSVARQGEMVAIVTETGANTYFGRTAQLVSEAESASHFQQAVLTIGRYLIFLSLGLVVVLIVAMLLRGASALTLVEFALVLIIASIPVAMPAVLSVTMAIGARILAGMQAILARLDAIEEMAGIDILCSDKTGTLTQNKLTLGEPALYGAEDAREIVLVGALASKEENQDAIDMAVIAGLEDENAVEDYDQAEFVPFDPVRKRTEATIKGPDGKTFYVTKGAPQVILEMCHPAQDVADQVKAKVDEFAGQGYRTLGVGRGDDGETWDFLGLLPLYDPPREDSAQTIQEAGEHGIDVKMVTGDNEAIARQIASQLSLGTNIHVASDFFTESDAEEDEELSDEDAQRVEGADGFAEVFPEHKYKIVRALQARDHIVGMTGDGVNDAPALKQANIGIAVSGATDAARSAAALVLTAPGLGVIVRAVEEARKIFERMNSYAIYRITETIRIMFFVVLAMIIFDFYPITTIMIILLALLNDLPIMTIAYDNTWLDPEPVRWNMRRVLTTATVLGLIGVVETFGMLVLAEFVFKLDQAQIQSLVYLKLTVAGHLTLLVARTRKPFLTRPYPAPILLLAILGTQTTAALIVGLGLLVTRIPWIYVGIVWGYAGAWVFVEDWAKLRVYHYFGYGEEEAETT